MAKLNRINIRLTDEEAGRLRALIQRAKERTHGYAKLADVLRELVGFQPMSALTEEDRASLLPEAPGEIVAIDDDRPGRLTKRGDRVKVVRG